MSVIIILVIIGISVAGLFLLGFIWAVKSGQYDDMYSPSVRILFDDSTEPSNSDVGNESVTNPKEKEISNNI